MKVSGEHILKRIQELRSSYQQDLMDYGYSTDYVQGKIASLRDLETWITSYPQPEVVTKIEEEPLYVGTLNKVLVLRGMRRQKLEHLSMSLKIYINLLIFLKKITHLILVDFTKKL